MRTQHQDKAHQQNPFMEADELRAQLAEHMSAARDWRTDAEKAGDPLPAEQTRIDEAREAWMAARQVVEDRVRTLFELRRQAEAGSEVVRHRTRTGDYRDASVVPQAELQALGARIRAAQNARLEAEQAAQVAHRTFNRILREVGNACTARRVRAEREIDFQRSLARQRAKGEKVDESRFRATWDRGEGPGFRVRLEGASQDGVEEIPAVWR